MSGKRKKFQYIINGGKMPRRTEYRMRKAQEVKEQVEWLKRTPALEDVGYPESIADDESQDPVVYTRGEDLRRLGISSNHDGGFSHDTSSDSSSSIDDPSDITPVIPQPFIHHSSLSKNGTSSDKSDSSESEDRNWSIVSAESANERYEANQPSDEEGTTFVGNSEVGRNSDEDGLTNFTEECISYKTDVDNMLTNKLCVCSASTEGDALLYCLALGIRHNLSWVAMVDILKMINMLYGYEVLSASKYYLQKLFDRQKSAKYHLYCSVCETYLGVKGDSEQNYNCDECLDTDENAASYFVSVDLAEQFASLMERKELANEILTYRFHRKKCNEDAYEDIFDGEAYKNLCVDEETLGNPFNFSYTFNTDGVQMGKSTRNAAWPIFVSINELSPQNRKKHMIFAGVWVGKTQPNMRIFLKPFVDEANKLSGMGFQWTDCESKQQTSRVFPLCCVLDSAARYKLLNLTSYTGYFGCTFCYQKAEHTKGGRRFTIPMKAASLRTHQSMLKDMNDAFMERNNPDKKKRIVRGCKGYTPLALMKYIALDTSFVVDSMHNSFLGVAKSHTSHLLTGYGAKYYIGSPDQLSAVCLRLCQIRPPSTITRSPRSIEEWKMWKASEWRSWLLFYVLVCLHGLIPSVYVEHLALFSTAMYLLLQKSMTYADIQLANQYLRKYVFLTEKYFGKTAMLYNTHLLLHLWKSAVNFGPLWTHTAFQFEGENHHFMQMRTSPGHVAKQLVRRYSIFTAYPVLCEKYASSEKPLEFLNEITGKSLKSFTRQDDCVLKGKGNPILFSSIKNYMQHLFTEDQIVEVLSYHKMIYDGVLYCTCSHASGKKHDDSFVSLGPNLKAQINNILLIKYNSQERTLFLIVQPFTVRVPQFLKTGLVTAIHVKEIVKSCDLVAIKPTQISGQCVHIDIDGQRFLADIPYGCLSD